VSRSLVIIASNAQRNACTYLPPIKVTTREQSAENALTRCQSTQAVFVGGWGPGLGRGAGAKTPSSEAIAFSLCQREQNVQF